MWSQLLQSDSSVSLCLHGEAAKVGSEARYSVVRTTNCKQQKPKVKMKSIPGKAYCAALKPMVGMGKLSPFETACGNEQEQQDGGPHFCASKKQGVCVEHTFRLCPTPEGRASTTWHPSGTQERLSASLVRGNALLQNRGEF